MTSDRGVLHAGGDADPTSTARGLDMYVKTLTTIAQYADSMDNASPVALELL